MNYESPPSPSSPPEGVREVFDHWARSGRAEGMERNHSEAVSRVLDPLDWGRGRRVLDLGCGNGYVVRRSAEAGSLLSVGVDLSPEMVARARERSVGTPRIHYLCGVFPSPELEAELLSLARGAAPDLPPGFDLCFSMEALYYLPDPDEGLRALRRLAAPGAILCCGLDFYEEHEESRSWPDDLGLRMHRRTIPEWRRAVEAAGFVEARAERTLPSPESGAASSPATLWLRGLAL